MHHTTPESPHDARSVLSLWGGLIDAAKFISGWVEHPQLVQDAGKAARDIPFGIRRAFQDYMKAYPAKFPERFAINPYELVLSVLPLVQ
ncbi:hypothetical protein GALMADRAFT_148459 [Galerina marginata CBS 339.88]|uniref:Uncharacterized protein n=1 Tax=Galerina marginata (strain CBS 339.88) TaxID=685588 RepID=A0A067SG60_GALM3|nr:hypothetical protein GALMADRAFT_148459 [Galerina marginata CBS 339.88]